MNHAPMRRRSTRVVAAAVAYVVALIATAAAAFVAVMVLAGPHGGVLPPRLQPLVLALAWLGVLLLPIGVARAIWQRRGRATP